jgi:hypothetical protein
MSANLVDDPRERLNYFNGQRLAALDFRAEQGHHDGMRRVLNYSLYSAGIVTGLEVEIDPADRHRVKVRRGLAFDHLGREIFLPEDVSVLAMGAPSTTKGLVFGNLLAISYREQRRSPVSEGCAAGSQAAPCSGDLTWGGPTRIAADATFEVLDSWPSAESGKVVIAQLELNAQCQVERVLPGARQYAMPVKPQKVRPISLEGEKDIDIANEKTLHFHIEDGAPERAVLMLRARKFSSLFYTEIGEHTHPLDLKITDHPVVPGHKHKLTNLRTDEQLDPEKVTFKAWVWRNHPLSFAFVLWPNPGTRQQDLEKPTSSNAPHLRIANTLHSHGFVPDATTDGGGAFGPLAHIFNKRVTESFGSKAVVPPPLQLKRNGKPEYTYIRNLQVLLDDEDLTASILAQLSRRFGPAGWQSLGDGTETHAIASSEGTREIDLLALRPQLGIGAHTLTFRLVAPKAGDPDYSGDPTSPGGRGGQIQYNLYID